MYINMNLNVKIMPSCGITRSYMYVMIPAYVDMCKILQRDFKLHYYDMTT